VHVDAPDRQRNLAYELFARNGGEDISVADEAVPISRSSRPGARRFRA
jgi:hypothetical protein